MLCLFSSSLPVLHILIFLALGHIPLSPRWDSTPGMLDHLRCWNASFSTRRRSYLSDLFFAYVTFHLNCVPSHHRMWSLLSGWIGMSSFGFPLPVACYRVGSPQDNFEYTGSFWGGMSPLFILFYVTLFSDPVRTVPLRFVSPLLGGRTQSSHLIGYSIVRPNAP